MHLVSNKPLNISSWRGLWMHVQKVCRGCCEDQAHSHRLAFIQESSSPLVMFYGSISGKKRSAICSKGSYHGQSPGLTVRRPQPAPQARYSPAAWPQTSRSDLVQEELTLLRIQPLGQILQPSLSSPSRSVNNDLMLSGKAEIQVRTGVLGLSNLHLSWYNFADTNQSPNLKFLNAAD